ncbi:MAG: DUF885 domain-containing protein [Pseudomonadota bacterium]
MRTFLIALTLVALSTLAAAEKVSPPDAGVAFNDLLERHWEWTLRNYPEFASSLGDQRYAQAWTDLTVAAHEKRYQELGEFLQILDTIDISALDDDAQMNATLFRRQIQNARDTHPYRQWLVPMSPMNGIQTADQLADNMQFTSADDYRNWIARLEGFTELTEQTITLMQIGLNDGIVAPQVLVQRLPEQVRALLVDTPAQSSFYQPFESMPGIDSETAQTLRNNAQAAIADHVLPAYRTLLAFLEQDYLPDARASVGISDQPNGADYYALMAAQFTTTALTPDEIHNIGLAEVERIRNEMLTIIADLEFDGGFAEFLDFLRSDPQFYFADAEDLLTAYRATSKRIDPELVRLFGKLPRTPYGVKPIPDAIAPYTTTAYYNPPAGDGTRAGTYFVNLYRPEVRPTYEIEVLTVHEAMPGHHLQIALAQELGDVPDFRRFLSFTAFVEGWGLYSESLGGELGLYRDPYSKFGQLTYEMWRAVRLVVDTGMHAKGWSRQKAIDFFTANAAKTPHDIANEIDRYIAWPGQALAYKIGELELKRMRAQAEQTLGDAFDVRAFHDQILSRGAIPLDVLETYFQRWLQRQITARD